MTDPGGDRVVGAMVKTAEANKEISEAFEILHVDHPNGLHMQIPSSTNKYVYVCQILANNYA
jgi:hypothetical protein